MGLPPQRKGTSLYKTHRRKWQSIAPKVRRLVRAGNVVALGLNTTKLSRTNNLAHILTVDVYFVNDLL